MTQVQTAELLNEVEFRRCAEDPEYFFESHCYVRHPSKGRIPFVLREAQRETLRRFVNEDRTIILKARQIGFSTLCAAYVLWLCMFHEDILVVMLSRTQRDAQDLLRKSVYAYDQLPQWMKDRGPAIRNRTLQKFAFENESEIESLPSREDPARGKAVSLVIVDEWAFLENPEEAWASIEPITDIGGRLIGLSTANGWGNFFHTLWVGARAGTNGFVPIFFPWDAVPERDDLWYQAKRSSMLDWQLYQEYPRDEDEAFIKSGNVVFDTEMLSTIVPIEPEYKGYLYSPSGSYKTCVLRDSPGGQLEVWAKPRLEQTYVIGADVAEGLEHGDFSSAHVIHLNSGRVVATWHGHIDADLFGDELARMGYWYNTALIGVESNHHGGTTLAALRRVGYPRIFYRHTMDEATKRQSKKLGFRTDRATKPRIIDELNRALREKENGLTLACSKTITELKTYVRDEKGHMMGSPHDDRVMSLAISNIMRDYAYAKEYKAPRVERWGTLEWWTKQVPGHADGPTKLGVHNARRDMVGI